MTAAQDVALLPIDEVRGHHVHVGHLEQLPGRLAYLATPASLAVIEEALECLAATWWDELDDLLDATRDDVERLSRAAVARRIVTRIHDPRAIDGGRVVVVLTAGESSIVDFALRLSSWLAPPDRRALIRVVLDDLDADTLMARARDVLLESGVGPDLGLPTVEPSSAPAAGGGGRPAAIGAAISIATGLTMVILGGVSMGLP